MAKRANKNEGFVYVIHFSEPFKHCRHYIGFTKNINARLQHHKANEGSRLLRALNLAGINYEIAATHVGDRNLERKMKNFNNSKRFCPICSGKVKDPHKIRIRNNGNLCDSDRNS